MPIMERLLTEQEPMVLQTEPVKHQEELHTVSQGIDKLKVGLFMINIHLATQRVNRFGIGKVTMNNAWDFR